jgi:hypothetical protein
LSQIDKWTGCVPCYTMVTMKTLFTRLTGKLSESDKYQITSWAFSYFMRSNTTVTDAVIEAIRKVRPEKFTGDGTPKLSDKDLMELELRVKNML